jgi:hypothetical protein
MSTCSSQKRRVALETTIPIPREELTGTLVHCLPAIFRFAWRRGFYCDEVAAGFSLSEVQVNLSDPKDSPGSMDDSSNAMKNHETRH